MAHKLLPLPMDVFAINVLREKMQRLFKVPKTSDPKTQNRPPLSPPTPPQLPLMEKKGQEGSISHNSGLLALYSKATALCFWLPN
jgi:hypothetical protein